MDSQLQRNDQRSDHWSWFIVESGLRILREQDYNSAFAFLLKHNINRETAKRVLDHPEQRRTVVAWVGDAKQEPESKASENTMPLLRTG